MCWDTPRYLGYPYDFEIVGNNGSEMTLLLSESLTIPTSTWGGEWGLNIQLQDCKPRNLTLK